MKNDVEAQREHEASLVAKIGSLEGTADSARSTALQASAGRARAETRLSTLQVESKELTRVSAILLAERQEPAKAAKGSKAAAGADGGGAEEVAPSALEVSLGGALVRVAQEGGEDIHDMLEATVYEKLDDRAPLSKHNMAVMNAALTEPRQQQDVSAEAAATYAAMDERALPDEEGEKTTVFRAGALLDGDGPPPPPETAEETIPNWHAEIASKLPDRSAARIQARFARGPAGRRTARAALAGRWRKRRVDGEYVYEDALTGEVAEERPAMFDYLMPASKF